LILGALAVLFLFGVLAAGGGWWWWSHRTPTQIAGTQDTPTPAPVPTTAPVNDTTSTPAPATPEPATAAPPVNTEPPVTNGGKKGSRGNTGTTGAATLPPTSRTNAPANVDNGGGGTTEAGGGRYAYLDAEEEAPSLDGEAAGGRVAGAYSSSQGGGTNGGGYGVGGRLRGRPRSPRIMMPAERPGVATTRYLMSAEERFKKKNNRYGSLSELVASGLALDVKPEGNSLTRAGYRFELTASKDEFKVTAEPKQIGPRHFVGDDSGFIRADVD
jgi:hypothetical protein